MIRTRFAPSPTGFLHIGALRTALYSYAFAKNKGGKFILRIEDTDIRRLVFGATEKIYQILRFFGLKWDEGPEVGGPYGPYIQSERAKKGIYQKYTQKLIDKGYAYYCFCPPQTIEEIKKSHAKKEIKLRDPCRGLTSSQVAAKLKSGLKPAVRLRVPNNREVSYFDFIRKKKIVWQTKNIDEVMLLKSNGLPTYHLGVVIDDALMKISHILRGHEWLPSTPVHLLLFQYLDFPLPQIGHFSIILDPQGGKLSKRKGTVSCEEFLSQGYLSEAILNFVMLLGWAPKDNRELFSLKDFVKEFANGNLQTANSVFNRKKLDWFNGYYIRKKSDKELFNLLKPFAPAGMSNKLINQSIPLVKERMKKLSDYSDLAEFLVKEPKVRKSLLKNNKEQLALCYKVLEKIKNWRAGDLEKTLRNLAVEKNWHVGRFFMTVRIAITGKTITPPLFESMEFLGKAKVLTRLQKWF